MRRISLLVLTLIIHTALLAQHDVWTQRAQSGGPTPGARYQGVAFSISNKGYVGTGNSDPNGVTLLKDFWEYDPVTDQWTQKADFGGSARRLAVGFAIGTKGYIGTGDDGSVKNDLWEYDPTSNTWSAKANFSGAARNNAVGFTIGTKGYIGTGVDGSATFLNDFYEYDQTSNSWSAKASLPAAGRNAAVGFSIGTKGYIGTGFSDPGAVFYNDFWEYDPTGNTWTQKANVGGPGRNAATGVSIANRGYIGMGFGGVFRNDFWEYDPVLNQWLQKANMSGGARNTTTAFNIGNDRCYISSGYLVTNTITNDIWEYKAWEPLTPGSNSITSPVPATLCGSGVPPVLNGSTPAGGNGIYSYQWLSSTDNINFTPIVGANSKDYAPGVISQTTYYKRAIASFYNLTDTSAAVSITVYAQPVAAFTKDNAALCLSGNIFNFTNTSTISTGTFTSLWSFGDGNTANTTNASHTYTSAGTYTVKLVITSNNGCIDSVQQSVTVYPQPLSNFTINNGAQCVNGNSFSFTNTSTISSGTFTSAWNFGDGNTANTTDASHSYASAGTYNVQLVTTSNNGCKDSVIKAVTTYPKPSPGFTINDDTQCVNGNSFSFTNTSSISSGTLLYNWYFGDGGTSTSSSPTYTYATAGTYTVKLVVSSTLGCMDSVSQTITVYPKPVPSFSINTAAQCVNGNNFSFTNTSTISSGTYTSAWNFGDGNTSTSTNASHSYASAGSYTVVLVLTSDNGCKDSVSQTVNVNPKPNPGFTINDDTQCVNGNSFSFTNTSTLSSGTMLYNWNFGDGGTSASISPTYSYASPGTYTVKLVVSSTIGCKDSISQTITVYPKPTPGFTTNNASQCLSGNSFSFTNTSSISSGTFTSAWNFGDGNSSTATNASHSYSNTGTYTVTLVITSDNGCKDSISNTVNVSAPPSGTITAPNGTFICGSSTALLQISGGTSYQWYLNNNPISGATGSSYNANQTGAYTVQIFSNSGCSAFASNSINITILPNPVAAFDWSSSCLNTSVQFNNQSTVPSGTPLYTWTFGTAGSSNNANPSFIFTQTGTYAVKLKVVMQGCSSGDSITKNITISAAEPGVKLAPADIIKNQPTQIFGRNFVNYQYNWIPSTGLSSSSIYNPVATLGQQQQYLIRMVSNISGCVTTDTLLVRIFDEPDIWVPKGFTPNGDGKNDILRPILVQIREFKFFRVYNRWGNLVFESRLPDVGWRGTYKDKDQPTETYTWVAEGIDVNGRTIRRTGATTLIR